MLVISETKYKVFHQFQTQAYKSRQEEESEIISFWVISHVKMELASNIFGDSLFQASGFCVTRNKTAQRLQNQTVLSGYRDSGAK